MIAYRIADARHPIFDPTGAMLHGGRWNSPGRRVIYAAETYAGALLELLVHANMNRLPKSQQMVRITIPEMLEVETVQAAAVPGWNNPDSAAARAFGDGWYDAKRTVVLRVPSVVTQAREWNVVLNAEHPDFPQIQVSGPEAVSLDPRIIR